ncbi:MAG: protein kinase [Polyangiaceae bacterium]
MSLVVFKQAEEPVDPKAQRTTARGPRDLLPGALVDGRYRVVKKLGTGGTSTVYEVEQTRTGGRLALKLLLDPLLAPRLEQEARATAKLKSHHVAHAIDFGNDRGTPYMVMPLLTGQSLRALLTSRPKLDLRTTANIVLQLAECLDEAHAMGLVHRDLKPENVHLSSGAPAAPGAPPGDAADAAKSTFHVTLLDFGVVKIAQGNDTSQLTRTGSTVGTPYYMSLEQLRGASNVDARADIYSMSVMLYECLAGVIPFSAATLGDLVFAICSAPPLALGTARPELPSAIVDIVMQGLASVPEQRPRTVRDVARVFMPHADPAYSLWLREIEDDGASQTVQYPNGLPLAQGGAAGETLPIARPAPRPPPAAAPPPAPLPQPAPPPQPAPLPPPTAASLAPVEGPVFGGAAAKGRQPAPVPPISVPSVMDESSMSDVATDDDNPTRAGTVPPSVAESLRAAGVAAKAPRPEPPRPLSARDRDTPTEMFSPATSAGGLFAPPPVASQRSLDPADATAVLSLPLVAAFPEPSTTDTEPNVAPENPALEGAASEVEEHPTGRPLAPPHPPVDPAAPPLVVPSFGDAPAIPMAPPSGTNYPSGAWPSPLAAGPPSAPHAGYAAPPPASGEVPLSPDARAPGSAIRPADGAGAALDRMLLKIGGMGRAGQLWFRSASATQQAVFVGITAAGAAIIVVLFVFLLVRC